MKNEMRRFFLNLRREMGKEKIEKYSNVGFGIVLYTPCDIGYAKDKEKEKEDAKQA